MYSREDFIRLNTNEFMDYDQAYGFQCVDMFNYYNQQVIGAPWIGTPDTGGAADLWNDFDRGPGPRFYRRIPNTPDGVPQYGDVIIWAANVPGVTGAAGHVGVFVGGDANSLDVFNQNYPTGSACHVRHFNNYAGVYGWLRPLAFDPAPAPVVAPPEPVAAPDPVPAPIEAPPAAVPIPVTVVPPAAPLPPVVAPAPKLTRTDKKNLWNIILNLISLVIYGR